MCHSYAVAETMKMNLDNLIGKKVRIIQDDGFNKTGVLEGHDDDFVFLRFYNGELTTISKNAIREIKEGGEHV